MQFAHPQFLFLLVVPIALAWWILLKPGSGVEAPVAEGVLGRQPVTVLLLKAGMLVPPTLLACFVVLLSRPVVERQIASRNPIRATNIEILLNASRSMLAAAEIGHHCRYCASKVAIADFVAQRHGNTMGISIFGSRHLDLVPLTADLQCLFTSISETYPDYIANTLSYGENFEEGLARSIDKLAEKAQPHSEQILILVTDGESRGLARHEKELQKRLAENGITLYVAMIAEANSSPVLARLALGTPRGRLFECRDAMGFFDVMRHIDQMNRIVYQDAAPGLADNNWLFLAVATLCASLFSLHLIGPFRPLPW